MAKQIILGVLMLAIMASLACCQGNINNPESSQADNTSPESPEAIIKNLRPAPTPIPVEEWPPPPNMGPPPAYLSIPRPEISGNVVKIDSKEVSPGTEGWAYLLMFVENGTDAQLGKFNLRITFDPQVINTDIWSTGDYLYDAKVDNTLGVVELSVNPLPLPANFPGDFNPGWIELGGLIFTAVGKPGGSTALHLTITSPADNLTAIDGFVHIKSGN